MDASLCAWDRDEDLTCLNLPRQAGCLQSSYAPSARPRSRTRAAVTSTKNPTRPRVNPTTGWAFAGSQRHIQAYVNTEPLTARLDAAIAVALPVLDGAAFEWRAPLAAWAYVEPRDTTFWPAIERPDLAKLARGWWPSGGPSWDAIAIARRAAATDTVVLVEAKANVPEFGGAPCSATSPRSIEKITAALTAAHAALVATSLPGAWLGSHYQLANRLAWTHWLRSQGVDAVFVHVVFDNDRSHLATTREALLQAARDAHKALGVPPSSLAGWAATVALPATG